ncbi:MAG: glycoside hydrolase family 18 protein, partial [Bacteroidales bacterium]|nr:glycoside hydrolase family 18 protein [Bacteroidales bacterium]
MVTAQDSLWVSAYYAGWMQGSEDSPGLRPEEIDYSAVTHIIHFSISPTTTGGINFTVNGITPGQSLAAVTATHAAGKKILICVGGAGTSEDFAGATSSANIELFIENLIQFTGERGYDGIDIDWEPLQPAAQFKEFIPRLRRAMKAVNPRWLLTVACTGERAVAEMKDHFDQINLMTYDMSGPWPGWVTWHNSPIFDSGLMFPSTDLPLPSANRRLDDMLGLGVPPSQLGFGIDFYGFIWAGGTGTPTGGVTAPFQSWKEAPTVQANVPYATIMEQYYRPEYKRWDSLAVAAYLSID